MKVKLPRISIPYFAVLKVLFVIVYVGLCAIVLLPQTDYQPWYPQKLPKYNISVSHQFYNHKEITINAPQEYQQVILETFFKRAKAAGITDVYANTFKDTIVISINADYSDFIIATLLTQGKVEILKPKDEQALQKDPQQAILPYNYKDFGIKQNQISEAFVLNTAPSAVSPYVQIEIRTTPQQNQKWQEIIKDNATGLIGISIDGSIIPARAVPPVQGQSNYPIIYYSGDTVSAKILAQEIAGKPLPISLQDSTIKTVGPVFQTNLLFIALGITAGLIALGLLTRAFILKQPLLQISVTAAILLAVLTGLKLSHITISIPVILSVFSVVTLYSILDHSKIIVVSIVTLILGMILNILGNGPISSVGGVLEISALSAVVIYIFFFLIGTYEKK